MATLKVMTQGGDLHEVPLPEGFQPTPENVQEILKQANIKTMAPTPMEPANVGGAVTPTTTGPNAFSRAGSATLRAITDRTTTPLQTLLAPDSSIGSRIGAGMQLGGMGLGAMGAMSQPELAIPMMAGPAVQAAWETITGDPNVARLAGGVTELGGSLFQVGRSIFGPAARAKEIISAARPALEQTAATGLHATESAGQGTQQALRTEFGRLHTELGGEFNRLEAQMVRNTPQIMPGQPGYGEAQAILNYIDDAEASVGGRADKIIRNMRDAMSPAKGPQQPINTRELVSLRKILTERAGVKNALDPDASVVGKKAGALKELVMDTLRSGVDQSTAAQYDAVRNAWKTQVADPETFLKGITAKSTTPLQAFTAIFAGQDPHKLRVTSEVLNGNQSLTGKLRLGFAEAMHDVVGNPEGSATALKRLETFTPTLLKSQLYSGLEIGDLRFLLEKNLMPSLLSELTGQARQSQVLLRGALGASMATYVSSNPFALIGGAIAFGGLPALRRAAMLPAGSQAQKAALSALIRVSGSGMRQMFQSDARQ